MSRNYMLEVHARAFANKRPVPWGAGILWDNLLTIHGSPHAFRPNTEVVRQHDHMRGTVTEAGRLHAVVRWWDGTTSEIEQFDPNVWLVNL